MMVSLIRLNTVCFSEKVCCSSFLFRLVDESILRFVRALIRCGEVQPAAALEARELVEARWEGREG